LSGIPVRICTCALNQKCLEKEIGKNKNENKNFKKVKIGNKYMQI